MTLETGGETKFHPRPVEGGYSDAETKTKGPRLVLIGRLEQGNSIMVHGKVAFPVAEKGG